MDLRRLGPPRRRGRLSPSPPESFPRASRVRLSGGTQRRRKTDRDNVLQSHLDTITITVKNTISHSAQTVISDVIKEDPSLVLLGPARLKKKKVSESLTLLRAHRRVILPHVSLLLSALPTYASLLFQNDHMQKWEGCAFT